MVTRRKLCQISSSWCKVKRSWKNRSKSLPQFKNMRLPPGRRQKPKGCICDVDPKGSDPNKCCVGENIWFNFHWSGITLAALTWCLIVYADIITCVFIFNLDFTSTYNLFNMILYQIFAVLGLISHMRAMFSDPGAVPKNNTSSECIKAMALEEGRIIIKCKKCNCIKPDRAHHCSACQRCIRKMDHHCPWINNCVGEYNQKYFILFTFYIALMSMHSVILGCIKIGECLGKEFRGCTNYDEVGTIMNLFCLFLEGLLFGILTFTMCGVQMSSIMEDSTEIERLKKEVRVNEGSIWMNFQAVFGKFSMEWFLPLTPKRRIFKVESHSV